METAIESGLRWGQLTELRVKDLDITTRILTVSRSAGGSPPGDRYSKRTLPGVVMRRSSGSVTVMTPNAAARPMPISE